jgi:hypothetical protein
MPHVQPVLLAQPSQQYRTPSFSTPSPPFPFQTDFFIPQRGHVG